MSPYEASEGKTVITIELRINLVKHLDDRASYLDCSPRRLPQAACNRGYGEESLHTDGGLISWLPQMQGCG
jgi:hypothetical protein